MKYIYNSMNFELKSRYSKGKLIGDGAYGEVFEVMYNNMIF
jgi:hypothetical protein